MAGYNIVLDIGGNAVSRSEKLAANLGVAAANATTLAAALRSVGTAAAAIPSRTIRVGAVPTGSSIRGRSYAADNGRFREYIQGMTRQSDVMRSMSRFYREQERDARSRYTRHRNTKIMSYGTGFNLGGFSGRFSTILQPDANGNILGMNAEKLMRGVNAGAIATSMVSMIGKAVLKTMAYSTAVPLAVGGLGIRAMIDMLQSEGFASGVRLISRRHQARAGLGVGYEQANSNADFLAASYGLDRSTALSSINVLTGLGIGGSGKTKVSLAQATNLTKVGGLISQQAGVPFERVMTNIQQLLVQATPNIRDIRELLNQAPVLGKYALKEMEERGVKGVDVRTFLKDQSALLAVLRRYELDNASNAGMRARGQIALARQDFWAKIAGNNAAWSYVGGAGAGLINSGGNAVNSLLSTVVNNDAFRVMVKRVENLFENFEDNGTRLVDKLITFIERAGEKLGLDLGDSQKAKIANDKERALDDLRYNRTFRKNFETTLDSAGLLKDISPSMRGKAINDYLSQYLDAIKRDENVLNAVRGIGTLHDTNSPWTPHQRRKMNESTLDWAAGLAFNSDSTSVYYPVTGSYKGYSGVKHSGVWDRATLRNPMTANAAYAIDYADLGESLGTFIKKLTDIAPGALPAITGAGATGSDLSGFNKDRRNLEIHFHDAIVKWTSNISTDDPQEVVAEVKQNIDQIASEAIQKAMLAATGKMGTRWI